MGVEFDLDTERKLVYVTASGETQASDWHDCFEALRDHDLRTNDMNVLLDFREHESVVPTDTVIALCGMVEEKTSTVKWAFVVSRTVSEGMVKMASVYLAGNNVEAKAFWDRETAEAWLRSKD